MNEIYKVKNTLGQVTWDTLKQDLMSLPKETLAEMVNVWLKTYWTNRNKNELEIRYECKTFG